MKALVNPICKMFNLACRHCSEEKRNDIQREGNLVDQNFKKTVAVIELGQYCNDFGGWVEDMRYCPVIWGNTRKEQKTLEGMVGVKRTTRTVKPVKKHMPGKSRTAQSVKAFNSRQLKKRSTTRKHKK
jgi:hypothetical protein